MADTNAECDRLGGLLTELVDGWKPKHSPETLYVIGMRLADLCDEHPSNAAAIRHSMRTLRPMFGHHFDQFWDTQSWLWRRKHRKDRAEMRERDITELTQAGHDIVRAAARGGEDHGDL